MRVIHPGNYHFKAAVYYRTYGLADTLLKYGRTVQKNVVKMAKRMTACMKPHTFDPVVSISTFGSVKNFKLACDSNGIPKGVATWSFSFFIKESASFVVNARPRTDPATRKSSQMTTVESR